MNRLLVMVSALGDQDSVALDLINQAMLLVDAARPIAGVAEPEGLGLTESLEWLACDVPYDFVYSRELGSVSLLPIEIILPRPFGEKDSHLSNAASARSARLFLTAWLLTPWPAAARAPLLDFRNCLGQPRCVGGTAQQIGSLLQGLVIFMRQ